MTGAPSVDYKLANTDKNELWDKLVAHDKAKDIMNLFSNRNGSDSIFSVAGIAQSHGYSLLSTHVVAGNKLVKARNPWGVESYVGPWSDEDARWTKELLQEVNHSLNKEDGLFFMDLDTLFAEFEYVTANYNTEGWSYDYHLQVDDNSQDKGGECWYMKGCTPHTVKVRSEVAQDVFITVHTWDDRGRPDSCKSKIPLSQRTEYNIFGGPTDNGN